MKKGGDRSLRTNSAFHSTFDITVDSLPQSLYVTIDGNYTFVIIELEGTIYALTIGWYGDYYKLSGFLSDGEKLTYLGNKLNNSKKTILLTTTIGGGAERVTSNTVRQKLSNWKQFEYIKSEAPILAIDLALDAADKTGSCAIS
jgi:hypothetical protein